YHLRTGPCTDVRGRRHRSAQRHPRGVYRGDGRRRTSGGRGAGGVVIGTRGRAYEATRAGRPHGAAPTEPKPFGLSYAQSGHRLSENHVARIQRRPAWTALRCPIEAVTTVGAAPCGRPA